MTNGKLIARWQMQPDYHLFQISNLMSECETEFEWIILEYDPVPTESERIIMILKTVYSNFPSHNEY